MIEKKNRLNIKELNLCKRRFVNTKNLLYSPFLLSPRKIRFMNLCFSMELAAATEGH